MEKNILKIIEFTEYPGPRYIRQDKPGHHTSGEAFYLYKLNAAFTQAYKDNKLLVLELDGVAGYPSSFLDEAIGELIYDFTRDIVSKHLAFETIMYKRRVNQVLQETYPQWEQRRILDEKVTHSPNLNVDIEFLSSESGLKTKHIQ